MAQNDWTILTAASNGALDAGSIIQGVTAGLTPPTGGGTYLYGFHALQAVVGVAGKHCDPTSDPLFDPMQDGSANQKGGAIYAAMRRHTQGNGYAAMIGLMAGLNVQTSQGYWLGLSNTEPYQIVLKKGAAAGGLDPASADVLRVSDANYPSPQWFDLRLDVLLNPHGDVVINVYRNESADVSSRSWVVIPGMDQYIDDSLGVLTGSVPLINGFRGVVAMYNDGTAGRVVCFDHVVCKRQLTP